MAGHRLGRGDVGPVRAEHLVDGQRFVVVAQRRRGGVGVDVGNLSGLHARIRQTAQQRAARSVHVRHGDMLAVRRESVSGHFAQYRRAPAHRRVVAFEDHGRRASARYQPVAVLIEGARCRRGVRFALREGSQPVETADRIEVHLLRSAAYDALLQSLPDHQVSHADRVRAAGAGRREGEVDAPQVEDHREVHRDGRVHRLEDVSRTDHRRIPLGADDVDALDHRGRAAVIAVDDADLVGRQKRFVHSRVAHRLGRGHVGVLALLGQAEPLAAVERPLQFGALDDTGQRRYVSQLPALRVQPDARTPFAQRFGHFAETGADRGPDAQSGDDYSVFHGVRCIILR